METIKSLLQVPIFWPALALFTILVIRRSRGRCGIFSWVEIGLAVAVLLLGGWQVVRSAADSRQQSAFIGDLQMKLEAATASASQAQQTIAELKSRTAWREITEDQARDFTALLWASPKEKVSVGYVVDDPEVAHYALALSQMMRKAGYEAPETLKGMIPLSPMGAPIIGVKISAKSPNDIAAGGLQQGLRRIGVNIKGRINSAQEEAVLVIVGRKSL